jgi:hypothetical protein
MQILYTSSDVRAAIVDIFSAARGRRVAVSAFVGNGAESFLPFPPGVELVCWPHPTGTNPMTLRKLAKKGVDVSFSDGVHMKVYWSETKGAVITSANLSTNAMGKGGLKEFGIRLPAASLDIDKVLALLKRRPMSKAELTRLDEKHDAFTVITRDEPRPTKPKASSFLDWYNSSMRKNWLLGWFDQEVESHSKRTAELVKAQYQERRAHSWLQVGRNSVRPGQWMLTFKLDEHRASKINWLFVDHVVRVARADKRAYSSDYPWEAVQVWPHSRYPLPPFSIDETFRRAFRSAVRECEAVGLTTERSVRPSKGFLKMLHAAYTS